LRCSRPASCALFGAGVNNWHFPALSPSFPSSRSLDDADMSLILCDGPLIVSAFFFTDFCSFFLLRYVSASLPRFWGGFLRQQFFRFFLSPRTGVGVSECSRRHLLLDLANFRRGIPLRLSMSSFFQSRKYPLPLVFPVLLLTPHDSPKFVLFRSCVRKHQRREGQSFSFF